MKKILALVLAMLMVFALCACGDSAEETTTTEDTAAAETAADTAAEPAAEADASVPGTEDTAAEGDLDAYKTYIIAYAAAGAPTEDEATAVEEAVNACTTAEEIEAVSQLTVLLENGVVMSYADWVAAGSPEADTSNVAAGDPNAGSTSGEASGEASGEIPAETPAA